MVWLDLAIVTCCGVAGLICGWIVQSVGGFRGGWSATRERRDLGQPQAQAGPVTDPMIPSAQRLEEYGLAVVSDVETTPVQALDSVTPTEGVDASHAMVIRAVSELLEANAAMQTQLKQAHDRIHKQAAQIESAERRAQTDSLTRVPNRRAFDKHIQQRAKLGATKAGTLALLDVDEFKRFNDLHGHQAGDEVLKIVAKIVHSRLRSYGLVARFGGEEFAILLDGIPVANAKSLVERARLAIGEREIPFENQVLRVTASIGLAEHAAGESVAEWIQRADAALYYSKKAGRDCGHWMNGELPVRIECGRRRVLPGASVATSSMPDGAEPSRDDVGVRGDQNGNVLADAQSLAALFDRMRVQIRNGTSMVVMAIRCNENIEESVFRALSQVVRAAVRGVDRIAMLDSSTLLVGMPSVEAESAAKRARKICQSADAIGLRWTGAGKRPFGIGITEVAAEENFSAVVSRSLEAADQARDTFTEAIAFVPCPNSIEPLDGDRGWREWSVNQG